jgi:hypothetical protein
MDTAVDADLDCIAQDAGQHVGRERLGLAGLPGEGAAVGRWVGRSTAFWTREGSGPAPNLAATESPKDRLTDHGVPACFRLRW